MDNKNLKLNATSDEDLRVISAHLQDSITQVKNIVHLKKNRIFLIQFNRFMWEDVERGVFRQNKRIRCAVKFDEISKIMSKNINQKKGNKILECLAINSNLNDNKIYETKIFFAGGGIISLFSEVIEVSMQDLGKPWNVKRAPRHNI